MKILARLIFVFLCVNNAMAAELFATVDALEGQAYVLDASGQSSPLVMGQRIYEGESIGTRQDGEVHLLTADGGFLALRPNTVLRVDAYRAHQADDDKIYMSLLKGALRSISGWIGKSNRDAYRLRTSTATIGIRGTDHETIELEQPMNGQEAGTYHRVTQGATVMRTDKGELELKAGEASFLSRVAGDAPRRLVALPALFSDRELRLERRIIERREGLKGILDQVPEVRADKIRQMFREATPQQRERIRQRVIHRAQNRRD